MDWVERYERQAILFVLSLFLWRGAIFALSHAGVTISWPITLGILVGILCVWAILWALITPDEPTKPPPEF